MNNLSLYDKLVIFLRVFFLQAVFNYEKFQNVGFLFMILPFLKKISNKNLAELRSILLRHIDIFNTNPYMCGFIVGNVLKMEVCKDDEKKITNIKQALACAFASIGDRIFWARMRLIVSFLTAFIFIVFYFYLEIRGFEVLVVSVIVPTIFYVAYSVYIRYVGIEYGWRCGGERTCGLDVFNWNKLIRFLSTMGFIIISVLIVLVLFMYGYLCLHMGGKKQIVIGILIPFTAFFLQRYFRRNKKSIFYPVISFILLSFVLACL